MDLATPLPAPASTSVIVWFDGACPLCRREIELVRGLDRNGAIRFIDVSDEGTTCPLDRAALLSRFHAQVGDGPIVSGAAAFAAMWRAVPLLRPLGLLARWSPFLALLEHIYRVFLRVRPAVQRLAAGPRP